jgi:hypothetical protein
MTITRKTLGEEIECRLGGSRWAMYRTAEHARFMLDNYVVMSSYGQLLTEKFSNPQEAYYLKQAQKCCGS